MLAVCYRIGHLLGSTRSHVYDRKIPSSRVIMIVVVTLLAPCVVVDHLDVSICQLRGTLLDSKAGQHFYFCQRSVLGAHNNSQEEGWLLCTRRSRGAPKVWDYLSLSTNVEKQLDGSRTQSSQFPNLTSLLETSYLSSP